MKSDSLRYSVDENPSPALCAALALIHVVVIFDGILFIPNVIAKTVHVPADTMQFVSFGMVLVAAVFTYLQSRRAWGIGAGFILFTGSYSAFMICSLDAVRMGGFATLAAMTLLTVPLVFLYTYFIRFFRHIITPDVGGVVILLIAVSMVPIALDLWSGGGNGTPGEARTLFAVGLATALPMTLCMLFGNSLLKMWGPLLAMACGYVTAAAAGQLHFEHCAVTPWFGLPPLSWPGLEVHLSGMHVPLLMAFAIAMIISVIENTGNLMLVQRISQRDFRRVSYDVIQRGLYCDGLSKVAAGLLGTSVPSVYCDNLPLVEMTGVASRRVGAMGAALLLVLAFVPKAGAFILDMPGPVMGGILVVMVALLFHAGIGLVTMNRLSNQHGIICGLAMAAGLVAQSGTSFPGLVPDALSPLLGNSVAVGGFTAFGLSAMAWLLPRRSVGGTFPARLAALPEMKRMLEAGRTRLGLSQRSFNVLSLCCEELFCHMAEEHEGKEDSFLTLRTSRDEDGYFTEVVCGHQMDDINNFALPEGLFNAKPEDLRQLGMVLFAGYARDVKHVEISGYSFISFYTS
ncbi:uracil-xanthine permease family protein [Desulfocurvus sp. DL9XJH121]